MKKTDAGSASVFDPELIHRAQEKNPFEKLSSIVFSILENAILTSRLKPGYRLNVTKIADALQISATPVREAVDQLLANGLVIIEQKADGRYSSYYVFDISNDSIQDLFTARKSIESTAAYLCAQKNWRVDLNELGRLAEGFQKTLMEYLDKMPGASETAHSADLDRKFHSLLVRSTGNSYLQTMYATVSKELSYLSIRNSQFLSAEQNRDSLLLLGNQHMALYRAVKFGFPELARSSMDEHIDFCANLCLLNRNRISKG